MYNSTQYMLNMHNLTQHWQSGLFLLFPKFFFSVVKLRTCLNIVNVFCMIEHVNLPLYRTDKFIHPRHFANSAVCCRFLCFSPSNFSSMIRNMRLFLLLQGVSKRSLQLEKVCQWRKRSIDKFG